MVRRTLFLIVFLLAGCSAGGQAEAETPSVVTLQSQAAAPSVSKAADQRVVFPFDADATVMLSMAKPWIDCVVKKGGPKYKAEAEGFLLKGGVYTEDPKAEAVYKSCERLQPETYEQHQLRTDKTTFVDNQREWYKCAQDAGYKLTAPDPVTGEFGLTEVGPDGDFGSDKIQACRRKAFTG